MPNLPAYVVLRNDSALPVDGARNWSSGFLPPSYQGVHFRHKGTPVLYLEPSSHRGRKDADSYAGICCAELNADHLARNPAIAGDLEARIASYELAARMQLHAGDSPRPGPRRRPETLDALRHRPAQNRQLRPALPDGPQAGRAGRSLRADLRRGPDLGHALQERRGDQGRAASRPTSPSPACSRTSSGGACSTRPWSSGAASSAGPRSARAATAATTTSKASASGWPAAESAAARPTAPPTSWATTPSRTGRWSPTCTPRSSTCSASTTAR